MISILMPIYNGIDFISDSIISIINQSFGEWELIIGVNGHPPMSQVYLTAKQYELMFKKIRVFDLSDIKGKSNALNVMVQYCNYDYVALLDVDDIWLPEKLEIQKDYLGKYDVVGTKCVYFGESDPIIPQIPIREFTDFNFYLFNPIINSSVIIKKELCWWNPKWIIEDYDLWLRLKKSGKTFYNCEEILVKHRIHRESAFNSKGNNLSVDELVKSHMNQ